MTPGTLAYLRSRRRDLGYSQAALAARIGVSRVSLSAWERGVWTPGVDRWLAWLDALAVPLSQRTAMR